MSRTNRSRHGKEAFYQALRDSFGCLSCDVSVAKITQTLVIKNAKFADGTSVGKTTLYGKCASTGEFIHKGFILELGKLIESANKKNTKHDSNKKRPETKSETITRLRMEVKELKAESEYYLAQFISIEESYRNVNDKSRDNAVQMLESQLYVVSSLLNARIGGSIKNIAGFVNKYETKYFGHAKLAHAKNEIDIFERKISDSTVTSIFGKIAPK